MEDFTNKYEEIELLQLISLCREHDDYAFAELVRRYIPMMKSVISRFSDVPFDFDELFSEACVALHSAVIKYDTKQTDVTFGLYARICVNHRLVDIVRRYDTAPDISDIDIDELSLESSYESIESGIADKETVEILMQSARKLLSEYEYQVLILHMQGYKTSAIAKHLGRTPKSVDNAKSRLFHRLRNSFGETY